MLLAARWRHPSRVQPRRDALRQHGRRGRTNLAAVQCSYSATHWQEPANRSSERRTHGRPRQPPEPPVVVVGAPAASSRTLGALPRV